MSIFTNLSLNKKNKKNKKTERFPVLVFFNRRNGNSMEFYGFHEKLCSILDGDDRYYKNDNLRAKPFMRVNSCPRGCSFTSYEGHILVVGGSRLSPHLQCRLMAEVEKRRRKGPIPSGQDALSREEVVKIIRGEYPSDIDMCDSIYSDRVLASLDMCDSLRSDTNRSDSNVLDPRMRYIIYGLSDRVASFPIQEFVNDKQKHETPYWKRYSLPALTVPRVGCHLLHCGRSLLALGGYFDKVDLHLGGYGFDEPNKRDNSRHNFLEVFTEFTSTGWLPLSIPDFGSSFIFFSVGEELLIGSNGSFTRINLNEYSIRPSLEKLDIECPEEFVHRCCKLPGVVVDRRTSWDHTIVVWQDSIGRCMRYIRGLHLGQKQHFKINLVKEKVLDIKDGDDPDSSKLIGFGDGTLAMIYKGREWHAVLHEEEEQEWLVDYWCVTFEIIYDHSDESDRVPYPGVQVKTRVISKRKCYAFGDMRLESVFVADVCFPDEVQNPSLGSIKETSLGLQSILQ